MNQDQFRIKRLIRSPQTVDSAAPTTSRGVFRRPGHLRVGDIKEQTHPFARNGETVFEQAINSFASGEQIEEQLHDTRVPEKQDASIMICGMGWHGLVFSILCLPFAVACGSSHRFRCESVPSSDDSRISTTFVYLFTPNTALILSKYPMPFLCRFDMAFFRPLVARVDCRLARAAPSSPYWCASARSRPTKPGSSLAPGIGV